MKNTKKVEKNVKIKNEKNGFSGDARRLFFVTIAVLLFLGLFYLLTVLILDDGTDLENSDVEVTEFQHDEILVGTSFSVNSSEYYVLYYETDDDEISSDAAYLVSSYRSSGTSPYLYTVDMSNALNAAFIGEEFNRDATKASELVIAGPTLIKFVDGKIYEYVQGMDDITKVLE